MKLEEVAKKKGTYAGLHFDHDTKMRIRKYMADNKIPNPLSSYKMHITLLFSRKHLPNYEPAGRLDPPWIGEGIEFDVWESQDEGDDGEKSKCLIMKIECAKCNDRHHDLMDEHGATFDFDEYTPHVTLSYNIGDFDTKSLSDPSEIGDLKIVNEYKETLNLDWAKTNT